MRARRAPWWWYSLGITLGVFALYQRVIGHPTSTVLGWGIDDPIQQTWFVAWAAHAAAHGLNPFVSVAMNVPHGINVMTNTSMLAVGYLVAPLTWLLGPVFSLNVIFIGGVVTTALSAALVMHRQGLDRGPAMLGGTLVAFGPALLIHGQNHAFMVASAGLCWWIDAIVNSLSGRWTRRRAVVLTSVWTTWCFFVSLETFFIVGVFVAGFIVAVAAAKIIRRDGVRNLTRYLIGVGVSCTLLLAVPLHALIAGRQHIEGPPHRWVTQLTTTWSQMIRPGSWTALAPFGHDPRHHVFLSGSFFNGGYLGVFFLLAVLVAVVVTWSQQSTRRALLLAIIAIIASLGAHPTVPAVGAVWSPYQLVIHLPGFSSVMPRNFSLVAMAALAWIVARGVQELRQRPWRMSRWAAISLATLAMVGFIPNQCFAARYVKIERWYSSPAGIRAVPDNAVVLAYPYPEGVRNVSLLDQADAALRYRLVGGQAIVASVTGSAQQVPVGPFRVFYDLFVRSYERPTFAFGIYPESVGSLPPDTGDTWSTMREVAQRTHVDRIVVTPRGHDPAQVRRYLTHAFGPGHHDRSGVWWWDVATSRHHRR